MRMLCAFVLLVFIACHSRTAPARRTEAHLVLRSRPGAALYLDRADPGSVMEAGTDAGHFACFRIGWVDSAATTEVEKLRYFQYRVQNDWRALAAGDTLLPVFFQERPGLDQRVHEGVMVFETPAGRQPDTLVYRDSYGSWGKQMIVLNPK
jgi:hypothetical protein